MFGRRRYKMPARESGEELVARLLSAGFLTASYATTEKTERLLAHDVLDDAVYWGEGADARQAQAIANRDDPLMAWIGGPFYVPEDFGGTLSEVVDARARQDELREAAAKREP